MGVLVGEGQGELPFLSCDLKKTKQPPPQKKLNPLSRKMHFLAELELQFMCGI